MNEKIAKVKNHIQKHRVAYAVVATATTVTAAHIAIANHWNEFLDGHDLTDIYYGPAED